MINVQIPLTLPEIVASLASSFDKEAIRTEKEVVTYPEFEEKTNQIANGLRKKVIQKGTRIVLLAKDSAKSYELLFGCVKAQAVLVPIDWRLSALEILKIIQDSRAKLLFVDASFYSLIQGIEKELSAQLEIIGLDASKASNWIDYTIWRSSFKASFNALSYTSEDVVVQMYTSGTTGKPKGVQITNRSFFKLLDDMKTQHDDPWMDLKASDMILHSVPFFHIGGLWWGVQSLRSGATIVIQDTFYAQKALEYIEQFKINKIALHPVMIESLITDPECKTTDLSSLESLLYGGYRISLVSSTLLQRAKEILNCDFYQIYGMTETGCMATCLRPDDHNNTNSHLHKAVGRPLPGVTLKIMSTDHIEVPTQTIGEVYIHSPSNMIGYWNNDTETKKILSPDGWIRTGDAGYIDQDGYLFICDRIKDMIISAGQNIYPAQIEEVLSNHPAIKEIAVIGIPDDKWGETLKAFVVLNTRFILKKRELIKFANDKLATFEIPQSLEFLDALPRNSNGKVLKQALKKPYWDKKERQIN